MCMYSLSDPVIDKMHFPRLFSAVVTMVMGMHKFSSVFFFKGIIFHLIAVEH